jgi:general secretion pathway protein I
MRSRQSAFTLLEVLIALAIFASAGIALMQATATHLTSLTSLEEITFANYVASNRLVEVALEGGMPATGERSGKAEMGGRTFYWKQKVEATTDKDLRAVTVEVRIGEKDESAVVALTGYRGRP